MVKTALDLDELVRDYVSLTTGHLNVERLFLIEVPPSEDGPTADEAWLLVISPQFEGLNSVERSTLLVDVTMGLDFWTTSWGFTPDELAHRVHPFLSMMLNQSREIYTAPQLTKMQEDGHD